MFVTLKYFGLPIGLESNSLEREIKEASTVEELLDAIWGGDEKIAELLKEASFVVNNTRADLQTVLKDKDELIILRVLGGG